MKVLISPQIRCQRHQPDLPMWQEPHCEPDILLKFSNACLPRIFQPNSRRIYSGFIRTWSGYPSGWCTATFSIHLLSIIPATSIFAPVLCRWFRQLRRFPPHQSSWADQGSITMEAIGWNTLTWSMVSGVRQILLFHFSWIAWNVGEILILSQE